MRRMDKLSNSKAFALLARRRTLVRRAEKFVHSIKYIVLMFYALGTFLTTPNFKLCLLWYKQHKSNGRRDVQCLTQG